MARFVFIRRSPCFCPQGSYKARIPEIARKCKPDTAKDVAQVKKLFEMSDLASTEKRSAKMFKAEGIRISHKSQELRARSLIRLPTARDPLINRLSPGESFLRPVPVGNRFLSHPPAQQNNLAFDFARKIEQADIDIFYLHANGIDLRQRIFNTLFGLDALRFAPGHRHDVDKRAPIQKNPATQLLLLGLNFFHHLLACDGSAQQRLEDR